MFSSVFDKVVSATAPDTLATFPPRADLPASSSTLCCLSFADRFISEYPTARATNIDDEVDGGLLLERAGPSVGIAISTDDLESTMERAAELGGRLAAALAGTVRSKRREPASASVPDLLTKVRGIFGNRLACIGREIRVSRNVQAERDETLLLGQIHALKNAALGACSGEKWCIVVSSGGESLVVCSIPLPAVEDGGACGCDFLVFDPSPRPAMKLRGSYIVKFTTVRGLQLHLISALGEIWRNGGLSLEGGAKKEVVSLSVVMKAEGRGEELVGRRQLQDSVSSLRKAEKAAAIKIKREEVEALRKALEKSSQQNKSSLTAPVSGGMFELTDGASELLRAGEVSDLPSGTPSFRIRAHSYRQQEPPRTTIDRSTPVAEASNSNKCDGDVEQTQPPLPDAPAPHAGLIEQQQSRGDHRKPPDSRISSGDRSQLRPPVAGVSPPLSARTRERNEGWRRWSEEDGETTGVVGRGEPVAVGTSPRREEDTRPAREREDTSRAEPAEQIQGHRDSDEAVVSEIFDNPLHRALLRSVEGEELAEYTKRAYSVYRAHEVIQGESELDDYPPSEPAADELSLSANQICGVPSTAPPASPANILHGESTVSCRIVPEDDVDSGERKECGPVEVGVRDAVRPFSPPTSSPQLLVPGIEGDYPFIGNGTSSAEPLAPTSGHELRVTDFSEAEDVVAHKPGKPATSPSEKFRSRLRAPRAGRALALASANAHRKRGSRRAETSPGFRRIVSDEELLPQPPPSNEGTTVPPRRKEAWIEEGGGAGHEVPAVIKGGHEPELAYSNGFVGTTLEVSEEDEDGVVARSVANPKKAVEHGEGGSGGRRGSTRQGSKSTQGMEEEQEHAAKDVEARRCDPFEHSSDDEHANTVEMSEEEWPTERPTATMAGCVPATSPAPSISPRVKATTPRKAKDCRRRRHKAQSRASRSETASASNSSSTTMLVGPPPLETREQGLHRSKNGDTGDELSTEREGLRGPGEAPDNNGEEFVWFGQPDTPIRCQSDEGRENNEVRHEEAPAPAPAPAPEAARTTAELQFSGQTSSRHQLHRSKAQLLLQMEVRRQRAIIEQAFRAREEEGRLRRARIGAEVFKRIQDLRRRRCSPCPSTVPTVPPTSGPGRTSFSPTDKESSSHDRQEREMRVATRRVQDAAVTSPPHGEKAVKAWGFRPALLENTAKTVQPERLVVADAAPSEEASIVSKIPPAETLAPAPPAEPAHRIAADNPWRWIVSGQKKPGLENGSTAVREPTPPPVRFNVEAGAFGEGAERPDGGIHHEQENARRQERYEALRARKMAEADERRRDQKQRQAAAREERRKTAAAAVVPDEEHHGEDIKNAPPRQNTTQHGVSLADGPSLRNNNKRALGTATVRPRSSSLTAANDDSYTRQGVSSLGHSNGSGGGRPTLPAPGGGNVASPAVRGFSRRSNRKLVRNAINFLCLAGGHLEKKKARVLEALDSHPASNFVVLLAHTKLLSFKGLYACSGEEDDTADRVFGLGPPQVDATMVSGFYKYNSAAREFREVHSKSLGKTTDAVSMEPTRLKRPKGLVAQ